MRCFKRRSATVCKKWQCAGAVCVARRRSCSYTYTSFWLLASGFWLWQLAGGKRGILKLHGACWSYGLAMLLMSKHHCF